MIAPRVSDLVGIINKIAPFLHAEEWDNVGLQVGDPAAPVERIMVALDAGPDAVEAAVGGGCQLLLTHHPLIFAPVKKVSAADPLGNLLLRCIREGLSVISLHTNYDIADGGVNDLLAERLGVASCQPLKVTGTEEFVKLGVFVPKGHEKEVLNALFRVCGVIGNYRDCSFSAAGTGTFMPLEGARPFVGQVGKREYVEESRIEVLLRRGNVAEAIKALLKAHPYEEPAYDLYPLLNKGRERGLGRVGQLSAATTLADFAAFAGERLELRGVRYVGHPGRRVKKVALCGGSGASLLRNAHFQGADLLVTGDVKYHEAREAEALGLAILDAGHFATERLMASGLADRLRTELVNGGFTAEVTAFAGERDPFTYLCTNSEGH